jgi:hypothetical protein
MILTAEQMVVEMDAMLRQACVDTGADYDSLIKAIAEIIYE